MTRIAPRITSISRARQTMTPFNADQQISHADRDFRGDGIELENIRPPENVWECRMHGRRAVDSPVAFRPLADPGGKVQLLGTREDSEPQGSIPLLGGGSA